MASKPRETWSEAYRKRIERGERLGKTRQQARGKRAGEHRIRKQREIEKYGLTGEQRQAVLRYLNMLPDRAFQTQEVRDTVVAMVADKGFPWFQDVRKARAALVANAKKAKMPGAGMFEYFTDALGLSASDMSFLLFYHG